MLNSKHGVNKRSFLLKSVVEVSKRERLIRGVFLIIFFLVHYIYSYPNGWSDDIRVSFDSLTAQWTPDIDVDSNNNIWIVWDDSDWDDGEVYFAKLDSIGNILIPGTNLSNNVYKSCMPRIAVDRSNNVQVIWRDDTPQGIGIWHAKIANDGSIIIPSHQAVSGSGGLSTLLPEMALDKYQNINIAWDEIQGINVMVYSKLDTMGNPIIEKMKVSPDGHYAYWVGIGVDSMANCHLACRTDSGGQDFKLTYSKIDSNGNFIIPSLKIADGLGASIICDKHQNIHMAFTNPIGPGTRIEYLKLDNNGNILVGPETLSNYLSETSTYADMAIDSNQCLHVVWQGEYTGSSRIIYAQLDTAGNILTSWMPIVYLPYTRYVGEPRIAIDTNNRLHVTWQDTRVDSVERIFYKYGYNEPGIQDQENHVVNKKCVSTIITGSINLPKDMAFRLFDITGRIITPDQIEAGIYFLEIDGKVIQKLIIFK